MRGQIGAQGERGTSSSALVGPLVMLVFFLLWWTQAATAALPSPAYLYDLEDEALVAEFDQADGTDRVLVGLMLADIWTSEKGPEAGQEVLAGLPPPDRIDELISQEVGDYARSILWAVEMRLGRFDAAKEMTGRVAARAGDHPTAFYRARIFDHLAFHSIRQGRPTEAFAFARRSSDAAASTRGDFVAARSFSNEALIMHLSAMYADSIDRFYATIEIANKVPFRTIGNVASFNLGLALLETGDHNGALTAFAGGVAWAEGAGNMHRSLIAHTYRSRALLKLGRPQEAATELEQSLEAQGDAGDPDGMAHGYLVLAMAQRALGRIDRSHEALAAGLALADRTQNKVRSNQLRLMMVDLLRDDGRLQAALDLSRTLVREIEPDGGAEVIPALQQLAQLSAHVGDYDSAYLTLARARELEEKAKGESYSQRLAMLSVANDIRDARRARVNAEARETALLEKSRRNNVAFLSVIALLGVIILLSYWSRERLLQRRLLAEQKRISQRLEEQVEQRTRELEREMNERISGEHERAELRDSLAVADKMGALGKLTGGVAHDFNNLLTVINGAAGILLKKPELGDEERMRLARAIAGAGDTGAEICRGLLAYARKQPLQPSVFDVKESLLARETLLRQTLGKGVELTLDLETALVEVDPSQFVTAVLNLLSNARDAMKGRGNVVVTVRAACRAQDDRVLIEVADTGCGMTADQARHASEPFYSTKESSLATGLGLSAVHGFVHQSGGGIEIDTALGQGTRMRLLLPSANQGQAPREWPVTAAADVVSIRSRVRTLLVDDNDAVASMLSSMLKLMGHEVTTARSPADALDRLEQHDFDLLVSDVVMPGGMNGVQLAGCVRSRRPGLRVLLLSGYLDDTMSLPFPFLAKPFSQDVFQSAIERIMGEPDVALAAGAKPHD